MNQSIKQSYIAMSEIGSSVLKLASDIDRRMIGQMVSPSVMMRLKGDSHIEVGFAGAGVHPSVMTRSGRPSGSDGAGV